MDSYNNPVFYINRDLSWLEFNSRVLRQAESPNNPLLERVKFLSIAASNLDEFFAVRVAAVQAKQDAGRTKRDLAGLSPQEQLSSIHCRAHEQTDAMYSVYRTQLLPALKACGIQIVSFSELDSAQRKNAEIYFYSIILPVIRAEMIESGHLTSRLESRRLCLIVELKKNNAPSAFALIRLPQKLPRLISLPSSDSRRPFVLLEELILHFIDRMFANRTVTGCVLCRVIRGNSDPTEMPADKKLPETHLIPPIRETGHVVRLEIEKNYGGNFVKYLKEDMNLTRDEIYCMDGPLGLDFLSAQLYNIPGYSALHYPSLPLQAYASDDLFAQISNREQLLHHPFQPFDQVVRLLEAAAADPQVLAIRQTLYRVSSDSPVVASLIRAAKSGKQVLVLVETRAKYDEENNIRCSKLLEEAGCRVLRGFGRHKVHGKILLIVRREPDGFRRYVHLGTGNYNEVTARSYTDYSMLTTNEQIGADAEALFLMLAGLSPDCRTRKLIVSPNARQVLISLIERARRTAQTGDAAEIFLKVNSITDRKIIEHLYRASAVGVRIRLLVRGVCCLRPGIKNVSENIEVHSVVGRFLEHNRVYAFRFEGQLRLYLSSADLMARNLDRRVELFFPVEEEINRARIWSELELYWSDNVQTSVLCPDGQSRSIESDGTRPICAQTQLINRRYDMGLPQ